MRLIQGNLSTGIPIPQTPFKIKMTEGNQAETYVSSVFLGKELKQQVEVFKSNDDHNLPNTLDYNKVYLDNISLKSGGEDCAPYRIMSTTIGGNHGYYKNRVISNGHGKVQVDVGSIYNDGTIDRVIWGIQDANNLWLSGVGTGIIGLTMTHVSGGTNIGSFTVTGNSSRQFYPVTNGHSLVMKIDGIATPIATGEVEANSTIVFEESYQILSSTDMQNYMIANVGSVPVGELPIDGVCLVTNYVTYTRTINTLKNNFLVLPTGSPLTFQDIMFVMGFQLVASATYPNLRVYIPKTIPFSQDGTNFDFANIMEGTSIIPYVNRVNITASRSLPTGILPDRHLYLLDGVGFAMGFLPILDADPSVRRTRANNKGLQLATSGKVYMSAIDDDGKSSLLSGAFYEVIAYKMFFESTADRTAFYFVESDDGSTFLYADWHNLPYTDGLEIPQNLVGSTMNLIEKSANVSYSGTYIQSTLDVTITNAETYGYLILQLT